MTRSDRRKLVYDPFLSSRIKAKRQNSQDEHLWRHIEIRTDRLPYLIAFRMLYPSVKNLQGNRSPPIIRRRLGNKLLPIGCEFAPKRHVCFHGRARTSGVTLLGGGGSVIERSRAPDNSSASNFSAR